MLTDEFIGHHHVSARLLTTWEVPKSEELPLMSLAACGSASLTSSPMCLINSLLAVLLMLNEEIVSLQLGTLSVQILYQCVSRNSRELYVANVNGVVHISETQPSLFVSF